MARQSKDRPSNLIVELLVEKIGARGDGIARYEGEPVFVPFAAPGDRVVARLGERRGSGREAWVTGRLASGAGRVDPPCPHFGTCGGCMLQHLDSDSYRAAKLGTLLAALERVGIASAVVAPLQVVPPTRRRARVGLARPRDPHLNPRIGFRQRFRHDIVDIGNASSSKLR